MEIAVTYHTLKGVGNAIVNKIDHLITKLTELKPALSDD